MQSISVPDYLVEQAKAATGLNSASKAVRHAIERLVSEHQHSAAGEKPLPLSKLPKPVQASERGLRQGKGKTFKSAAAAMRWLES